MTLYVSAENFDQTKNYLINKILSNMLLFEKVEVLLYEFLIIIYKNLMTYRNDFKSWICWSRLNKLN